MIEIDRKKLINSYSNTLPIFSLNIKFLSKRRKEIYMR